jgi:outer membrane receptor protein involved in Fe transport
VVYKPVDAATLRASFGRSFRAPPNLDLYSTTTVRCIRDDGSSGTCTAQANPDLEPETGTTWELGGEWRFTKSTRAGLTLYETRLEDLIYTQRVPVNVIERINAGEARIRGIELTGHTRLTAWLELDANYAWIDSEVLENDADPDSVGKRLTHSPEHIAGIGLTARQGPWTGTLEARYLSHVYFTADNSDTVEGVPGSYDAYTLVNAKAGYAFSKTVKASLGIHNLLDEEAYSFFLLAGRSAFAGLDFSF